MATSPSHQLGEWIGDFFEVAIIQYLKPIVSQKGYYLDYKHPRPARGNRHEVIGTVLRQILAHQKPLSRWPGEDM